MPSPNENSTARRGNVHLITNLVTGEMRAFKSDSSEEEFRQSVLDKKILKGMNSLYRQIDQLGISNFLFQLVYSGDQADDILKLYSLLLVKHVDTRGSSAHRQKIAARWSPDRRAKQAAVARETNRRHKITLKDYICPDCGQVFEQVTKGIYGGHRKACLHWKQVAEIVEEEMGKTLDEILEE